MFNKINLQSIFLEFEYFSRFCPKAGAGFLGSHYFRLWYQDGTLTDSFQRNLPNALQMFETLTLTGPIQRKLIELAGNVV